MLRRQHLQRSSGGASLRRVLLTAPILFGVATGVAAAGVGHSTARTSHVGPLRNARATANSATFQDSAGENPAGADITAVTVSNDDAGMLSFAVSIPNRPALGPGAVIVYIDSDRNATNGAGIGFEGAEFGFDLEAGSVDLGRWNGSKFDFSAGSPSSLTFTYTNGVATIRVKAADVALTTFNFWIAVDSNVDDSNSIYDFAPDAGHGTWSYEVKISPPAPTVTPQPQPKPKPKVVPKCKKGQKSTPKHRCHK